jgi:murein DD-endopeptidase MepM/ murein hydrolase activator NlpD
MLENLLRKYQTTFHRVVPFDATKDKLLKLDFTKNNTELSPDITADLDAFANYVSGKINKANARYGIGGYDELRTIYVRSKIFDSNDNDEPRRLHLGIDIWGNTRVPVFAPLGGMVHSFAYNNSFGDYGATIILLHQLDGTAFYTLYGHLSLKDITSLTEGSYVNIGQQIGSFGAPEENGQWPPHLHFHVIEDMEYKKGDYAGVCRLSEREKYLNNCPDPDIILQMMEHAV